MKPLQEKLSRYRAPQEARKAGIYPYFRPISSDQDAEVTIDGKQVEMTHTQFKLLTLFLTNPNIALSRDRIIENIWGYEYEAEDRTIDAHIKLLRSKLGSYRDSIKTIRKVGYKFEYEKR